MYRVASRQSTAVLLRVFLKKQSCAKMSGKNGRNAVIEEKINSILIATDKLTERISYLETKFETFEIQLMTSACKYSALKLENEISALDLNETQIESLAT